MLSLISRLLAPPVFADEEQTRVARLLNVVLLVLLGTSVLAIPILALLYQAPWTRNQSFTVASTSVMAALLLGLLLLAQRGHQRLVSVAVLVAIWGVMTYWILGVAGIASDTSPLLYPLIVVLGGVLLGGRAAFGFTLLCLASVLVAYLAEASGFLVVPEAPVSALDPLIAMMALVLTGTLLHYAMNNMMRALAWARTNERAQLVANRELEAMRESLEQRVADRTYDLARHSQLLQAAVEVGRAVTSILDPDALMWKTAELIGERFDLYHVGIFQVDAGGRWALYRAGAGVGGRALAEEVFRLEVGGESLVGWCTAHRSARVVADTGIRNSGTGDPESVEAGSGQGGRFVHPLVPQTRSEAALPLLARGQILGAISLQSRRTYAFDEQTVASLQTMADQVAVALDNARLYEESQQALEATRRAYGEFSRQSWDRLLHARGDWGYVYAGHTIAPAGEAWQPGMAEAMERGALVENDGEDAMLSIPLQVRDQVIGALGFAPRAPGEQWTAQEIDLLETLARQLGVALESAQLFEETQRRAARERLTGQVAARIRETLDLETVLKTAAQEIRQALGVPEVVVRLASLDSAEGPAGIQRHSGGRHD